mmetsp:Transcript_19438/g.17225  ORF Transcript_19438/g.17225 Transcript_19438/m.17225 type:complete len:307 (-) Transcript_19438:816-1736(-)
MALELSEKLINSFTFLLLWIFYVSIYTLGGIFTGFQWDMLLLEAGFISIFVAPLILNMKMGATHAMNKQYVRWLVFRLMLGSGLVKLLSGCPTWWELTALHHHFETQPLPNGFSWFAHQLPEWAKRLGTLDTHVIEIIMPLFLYSPIRSLRIFAGIRIHLFMILIMLTGNYTFFNLLTMVINVVNFDDEFLIYVIPGWVFKLLNIKIEHKPQKSADNWKIFSNIIPVGFVIIATALFEFNIIVNNKTVNDLFTLEELKYFLANNEYLLMFVILIFAFIFFSSVFINRELLNQNNFRMTSYFWVGFF